MKHYLVRNPILMEVVMTVSAVTALSALMIHWLPASHATLAVAILFLAATWWHVWRKEDEVVRQAGLQVGGMALSAPLEMWSLGAALFRSIVWALGWMLVIAGPFMIGWRVWWRVENTFVFSAPPLECAELLASQLILVAFPEEAFYRGYVQSRLEQVWSPCWSVGCAKVGPSIWVTSVMFAVAHVVAIPFPERLAVFFPSLLFGWLRARLGGIGAAVWLHAACNCYSDMLGRGYGLY
ncbi:myxosortase MrtC [Pajaroellobacter abortibovis]|nr:MrtC family glutamic-type intramembrane protease [Pajaroellobacter abortibovis]